MRPSVFCLCLPLRMSACLCPMWESSRSIWSLWEDLGASVKHLRVFGTIWEVAAGSIYRSIWGTSGETPGRDLGAPGAPRRPRRHLGADCVHLPVFYQQKWRDRAFRVHGTSPIFTLIGNLQYSALCAILAFLTSQALPAGLCGTSACISCDRNVHDPTTLRE